MKRLIVIILISFSVNTFSQNVQLTVQTGHSAAITDVVFSPFDDYIATAGADNKIVIWDFASSKQFGVLLGHKEKVTSLSFHPDNKVLISSSEDSTIKFWDYQRGTLIKELKMKYSVPIVLFNHAGDKIYIGGDALVSLTYPQLEKETLSLQPKEQFETIALSNEDDKVLVGGPNEHFGYLFDLRSKQLLKKFTHSMIGGHFDDQENEALFCTNNGLALSYSMVTEKKKGLSTDWMLTTVNEILTDSLSMYTADDYGIIHVFQKDKWFQKSVLKGRSYKINSMTLSNDGRYLVSAGNNKAAIVWDLKEMRVVKVMQGMVNRINDIEFSDDGKDILVVYEDGSMRISDLITNQTIVNKLSLDSDLLSKIGSFSMVRIVEFKKDYAIIDALYKQSSIDMEGVYDVVQEHTVKWTFDDNLLHVEQKKEANPKYEKYIKDLKMGKYHDNTYFQDTTLKSDESDSIGITAFVNGRQLDVHSDEEALNFTVPTGHSDMVTSIEINERYGFIATASWDGMIRFWSIEDQSLLTVFGAFGDGQFVYVNPEGYYFSSKNALNYIGFSLDNQMFSFEQFDLKYNRPDLVISKLPYFDEYYEVAFEKAYRKRLDKLGISEADVEISKNIPKIELQNDVSTALTENELYISLKCKDRHNDLERLHVFVNGVPEFGRFGKEVAGNEHEEECNILLNPGTNYIQCYVTNENKASSLKNTFKIEAPRNNDKSDLYVLSIGVSAYEQSQYNLSYAAKDARDINEFFSESSKFDNIKTQMLLDAAATRENINSMKKFFAEAKENDVVLLFVAGHGVLDDELDYFFAPHDMDFDLPSKNGVPFEIFDEILDNTKCRKKIMFLDACHSGEIDKDEVIKNYVASEDEGGDLIFRRAGNTIRNINEVNSFELSRALFADMRINNGSTVISSSGGAEYAIEGEQWNNGVFTYTVLKGLRDKKADYNKDRRVTLSELQTYVQSEVHNLTNGMQTPTSRVENLNYDFVIN